MATQNFETLRARVQALDDLPDLIKPFTIEGTKLRLPKDIADKLDHVDALQKMLASVHYEGVHYDYQDEPNTEEESTMATPLAGEAGVNEAFARRVGAQVDQALFCIERARRIADVCGAAVASLEAENSADIASMMGNELFAALDEARKALEGKTR